MPIQPVPLPKAYRLLNTGATVMVSAQHQGVANAMSAAWVCALDYQPAKLTVVLDKAAYTRHLIEQSGWFAVQIPVVAQADLVMRLGSESRHQNPEKMNGVALFQQPGFELPLLQGCAGWLACRLLQEPHNQHVHDLFIGEIVAAWADDRVFRDGRWRFEQAGDEWRTLHYVAGGQFYAIGKSILTAKAIPTP